MRKVIKVIDRTTDRVLFLICLLVALFGVYVSVDAAYVYRNASADKVAGYKPEIIKEESLQKISKDCIGWITMDDTTIDYPLMQGATNTEYLNKDPEGKHVLSGSIFLDSRNSSDFTDPYSLIYGHHMEGGFMFGSLDDFEKEEYFTTHRTGTLYAGDIVYEMQTFAFLRCDASEKLIFDIADDRNALHDYIKKNSLIYRNPEPDKRVVALSTCKSPRTSERTVLFVTIRQKGEY